MKEPVNELPKSVRDQLARQQRSGVIHPDADVLTAFVEGTATPAERVKIEEHLASCSECREVMFLATPPVESVSPVAVVAPKTGSSWIRLWAPWAAAAVVLVVATFTFTNKGSSPQMQRVAKNESTPLPARPPSAETVTSPLPKSEIKNSPIASGSDGVLNSEHEALDATKQKDAKVASGRRDKEEFAKDELKKSATDSLAGGYVAGSLPPAGPPPPPPAAKPVETYAYNPPARNTTLKPGPAAPMQNQAMQNQQNQSLQDLRASKSTEAVVVNGAPAMEAKAKSDQAAGASAFEIDGRSLNRWRISADGSVERTSGNGWSRALARPGTKFTVVATVGPIVWAGGTGGVLLRSVDNGASWQSMQLPNISTGTNSTITKIEFRDAFTGTVSTSDHRTWSTRDRGENWQQP
jgi:hypothetical protein